MTQAEFYCWTSDFEVQIIRLQPTATRDCAIDLKFAVSASPSDDSIVRRHATLP
jgi:hypothetical protein